MKKYLAFLSLVVILEWLFLDLVITDLLEELEGKHYDTLTTTYLKELFN